MKVNIYYGGRGLIEDPTLYVINKLTEVLEELRVEVARYNLYEEKNGISMLPKTLKEADGVILATTIEWFGIGGYMQQFLDACWLYGDKEKISKLYMLPIVMATTYGEKAAKLALTEAWEMLGGIPMNGFSAYVDDHVEFETNTEYCKIIEKEGEDLYRAINKKVKILPSSNHLLKENLLKTHTIDLTPQESEQLSMYVSDDAYVKKQKEDIEELTQMFKELLEDETGDKESELIEKIKKSFCPQDGFNGTFAINIEDRNETLVLEVNHSDLKCYYGEKEDADVTSKMTYDVIKKIVTGNTTFQNAFMAGELTAKGNFKTLRMFDTIFRFELE